MAHFWKTEGCSRFEALSCISVDAFMSFTELEGMRWRQLGVT